MVRRIDEDCYICNVVPKHLQKRWTCESRKKHQKTWIVWECVSDCKCDWIDIASSSHIFNVSVVTQKAFPQIEVDLSKNVAYPGTSWLAYIQSNLLGSIHWFFHGITIYWIYKKWWPSVNIFIHWYIFLFSFSCHRCVHSAALSLILRKQSLSHP